MLSSPTSHRAFLESLFSSIAARGWTEVFFAALHDDVVFNAMGTSAVAGTYHGKQAYREQVIDKLDARLSSWPRPIVESVLVEGNRACLQFHAEGGKGHNGVDFNMHYCWVIQIQDDKISEIWGYYDAVKMAALFCDTHSQSASGSGDLA